MLTGVFTELTEVFAMSNVDFAKLLNFRQIFNRRYDNRGKFDRSHIFYYKSGLDRQKETSPITSLLVYKAIRTLG